jgi:hypothetical protein
MGNAMRPPWLYRLAAMAGMALLSGCLTIEENYTFRKDGSGTMEYVVDMSELGKMLDGMKGMMDGKEGGNTMDMNEEAGKLKTLEGIARVKCKEEKKGFVQRLSFRFQDVAALNRALNVLMPDSAREPQDFFRWEGNTLVRTNNGFAAGIGAETGGDSDTANVEGVLKSMKYKYSFKFAQTVLEAGVAPGMAKASPTENKLALATDFSVIAKDPAALDLRITLEK